MKLMIIGIDAMDPRILFDNIDMFPNMKKLCEDGSSSSYDAYAYGYGSRDNWVSLYTGLSPNQHGIIKNINTSTKMIPNYNDYKSEEPFWKLLSNNDIKSAIWRGLATSPGEKINGYMITGEVNYEFDGTRIKYESMEPQCYKDDIHIGNELIKKSIGYPLPPKNPLDYGFTWGEFFEDNSLLDEILKKDNYYESAYLYLEKELDYYKQNIKNMQIKYPTDVLFYYTSTLDLIQHFQSYDPSRRIVLDSMKLIDSFIGDLMDELNSENVIIMSDHGISSLKDVLKSDDIEIQKEAFGWRDKSIWLKNGELVTKARNGGLLNGLHDIKGTFIISGKDIKKGKINDMRTLDFYPTLLELFDIKIPEDREGYVLDIFESKEIVNKDKLLKDEEIKYKKILLVQNMGVPEFNTVINEVFLDHRFHEITLICEEKYMSIFEVNPRLKEVLNKDEYNLDMDLFKDYEFLFFGYKNDATKEIKYMKLDLS